MKRIRDIATGIFIGALLMAGAAAGYAEVKQYMLTDASYPIYVNGTEYADAEHPILNYEGSTYVPLAKLGDITGVNYKWNEDQKRVEIDVPAIKEQQKVYSDFTQDIPNYAYVAGIPDGKRIDQSDGISVLYKYDVTDISDSSLQKYDAALEEAGYVYEEHTSSEEIIYYSKGKTVVGLWIEGYDFYVLVTTD